MHQVVGGVGIGKDVGQTGVQRGLERERGSYNEMPIGTT